MSKNVSNDMKIENGRVLMKLQGHKCGQIYNQMK